MLAKKFFGVSTKMAKLVQADAINWLENYNGPAFDMIIDDLFGEKDGEPVRAVKANPAWLQTLTRHLGEEGVLVMNFISEKDLANSAAISYKKTAAQFKSAFQFTLTHYVNAVGAFLKMPATTQVLRKRMNAIQQLKDNKKLDFHVKKIK